MNSPTKQQVLQQIAAISAMERGKLCAYSFKDRPGLAGPYHKLQQWEDGKNRTRYVPADELTDLEAALAGYAQYQELTRQYADLVIAETRQNIASKKRAPAPNPARSRRGNPATNRPVPVASPPCSCRSRTGDPGAHGGFQISQ
jgi:hypothetical protein